MRSVNHSTEPEMTITHECGEVISYYLSDIMNMEDRTLFCPKCKGKIPVRYPNYMMVQMENGKPILRIDIGLVLDDKAMSDPNSLLSAWVSYMEHLKYPLTVSKDKCIKGLPDEYKQRWWNKINWNALIKERRRDEIL